MVAERNGPGNRGNSRSTVRRSLPRHRSGPKPPRAESRVPTESGSNSNSRLTSMPWISGVASMVPASGASSGSGCNSTVGINTNG